MARALNGRPCRIGSSLGLLRRRPVRAWVLERRLRAGPLAFRVVLQRGILASQLDDGVVALVHVQIKPVAFDTCLADAAARRQPTAIVAAGTITGEQRRQQTIGEAALGLLERPGHADDDLAAGQRVSLADVET